MELISLVESNKNIRSVAVHMTVKERHTEYLKYMGIFDVDHYRYNVILDKIFCCVKTPETYWNYMPVKEWNLVNGVLVVTL